MSDKLISRKNSSRRRGRTPEHGDRRLSRSVRIRKYGSVYNKHMKSNKRHSEAQQRKYISRRTGGEARKETKQKTQKRKLTDYQKFVKRESRKNVYKYMRGSERMLAISNQWKIYKSKLKTCQTQK